MKTIFMLPAVVLLSSSLASHSCAAGILLGNKGTCSIDSTFTIHQSLVTLSLAKGTIHHSLFTL